MATVIPAEGEVSLIAAPSLKEGLDRLVQKRPGTERMEWVGPDGEIFFYRSPGEFNPRATKFMSMRGGTEEVTGTAVFLSKEEWKTILEAEIDNLIRTPPTTFIKPLPEEVELSGNTHLVETELRKLGARCSGTSWWIHEKKADEAQRLIAKAVPRKMGEPLRNRIAGPCVFCGIEVEALGGYLGKNDRGQPTVRCRESSACRMRADSSDDSSIEDLFVTGRRMATDPLAEMIDEILDEEDSNVSKEG